MGATKRGVYHNLKESEYVTSNGDVTYFFSSKYYMNKFLIGYEDYRDNVQERFNKLFPDTTLNVSMLADAMFYNKSEKRGFYVWIKGVNVEWQDLQNYALTNLLKTNTKSWYVIHRPKLSERKRIMENRG